MVRLCMISKFKIDTMPIKRLASGMTIVLLAWTILFSTESVSVERPARALPALSLNDLDGQQHELSDWRGRVILLNFWATWCGPCQTEIPAFIRYQAEYADRGLQIIGVGLDETRKLRNYVRTVGINYPVLQADPDRQFELLNQWGDPFGVLPYSVVLNRDGRLVFMQLGIFSDEAFARIVKPLLDKPTE